MCLQASPQSGFSAAEKAAEATCREKHEQIKAIKPIKINTVCKVTNKKDNHKLNVTTERRKHKSNVTNEKETNKLKQHSKQLKRSRTNIKTVKLNLAIDIDSCYWQGLMV